MRRLVRISLICLAFSGLAATSASASVTHDGWGLGLADDTHFTTPIPNWGPWFERLRPKAFRMQMRWNSDATQISNAKTRIFYVRARGVQQVLVTFRLDGAQPSPADYGQNIGRIVTDMAGIVDAWGPVNEPNVGSGVSATNLAQYWQQFSFIVSAHDPTALKTSPDFADHYDLSPLSGAYMYTYLANGGGWGNVAAWHPYWGVHRINTFTTDDFMSYVPSNIPIWLTEVGGFGTNTHHNPDIHDSEDLQAFKVQWLINAMGALSRIQRIFYFSVSAGDNTFDTGLLNAQGTPRQAWDAWCAGSHHDNSADPDCVH
jgi:hypothetical protein